MPGEPPGWLYPRGSYVFSSTVVSTRTFGRGLERKLYHSSVRVQRFGNSAFAGLLRPATFIVASWNCWLTPATPGWSRKYAPTRPPYHGQSYSVSAAAWIPV